MIGMRTASSLIAFALMLLLTPLVQSSEGTPVISPTAEACANADCTKAAYSLKIINNGEGSPKSANTTAAQLQDNRRVDVTLARNVQKSTLENRSIELSNGGALWVTKDPVSLNRLLKVDIPSTIALDEDSQLTPFVFRLRTNYAAFLDRWEIRIYAAGELIKDKPLAILPGNNPAIYEELEWDGIQGLTAGAQSTVYIHDQELEIVIRAYDSQNNYDQTQGQKVRLLAANKIASEAKDELSVAKLDAESELQSDRVSEADVTLLATEGVLVRAVNVRVHGIDIDPSDRISINNEKVDTGSDREFVVEYLLPAGRHTFEITNQESAKIPLREVLEVDVDTDYFFMVALADLTIGENTVSGSVEPLLVDEHHYGGDIFVDGRLAFYLKGKVKGKYLITAQMDTGVSDVEELFEDIHTKDPASVFRRLDPDQYYLVYGDDSTVTDDTDSQGKLYFRADWDKSHALWGNFNTGFSGTELAGFNRSLYGAQVIHRNVRNTALGDAKQELSAFASKAQSAFRHNEFLGTGGSLYYLRDKDIVSGSEKVWVEVRQSSSDRVLEKILLVEGRDYDIDDFQGRIILTRPLLSISAQGGPSIIRDQPLPEDNTYLVVDYEFVPDNFDASDTSMGVRGKTWFGDHVALGGTWAHENRDSEDYDIKGIDLTLKHSNETFLKLEIARSTAAQTSGSYSSNDGGLNFTLQSSNLINGNGNAFGVEARMSASDFGLDVGDVVGAAWLKQSNEGFSSGGTDTLVDTLNTGLELNSTVSPTLSLSAAATHLQRKNTSRENEVSAQADKRVGEKLTVSTELRALDHEDLDNQTTSTAALAAAKLAYKLTEQSDIYASAQETLSHTGTYTRNNQVAVGSNVKATERLALSAEYSAGDRGKGTRLGFDWQAADTYSLYSNLSSSFDSDNSGENVLTVGQRKSLTNQLKVYSEHQFSRADESNGISHTLGLDHSFNKYLSGNMSLQSAKIDSGTAGTTHRNAISMGMDYKHEKLKSGHRLEYRRDKASSVFDEQWIITNRFEYKVSPSVRWQGKLNGSVTQDRLANNRAAKFIEAGLGFAFRPIKHDRLNMLGRLTYLFDMPPIDQDSTPDTRSAVASFEGIYDLTNHWSMAAKLAHKNGEIRIQRDSGDWIGNDASLAAARLHYRVPFGFEAMLSHQWLISDASQNLRKGTLISVGRAVADHLRMSVGYNFTDFDDDLTNEDYKSQGWFLNLSGYY